MTDPIILLWAVAGVFMGAISLADLAFGVESRSPWKLVFMIVVLVGNLLTVIRRSTR